jgi:hypothetical protein
MPSQAEMWRMLQAQQKQIEELTNKLKKTEEKTEAVAQVVDSQAALPSAPASSAPNWYQNTQLGGYGELHYNGGDKDEIDFHRFVAFISHQFSDRIRLYSEVELEHSIAGDGQNGEVELEQAFLEFDLYESHRAKAGLFLLPIGILNEKHEPTTFFGVERNPVENNIIPTTWWEAGLGASGDITEGFKYDLAFHSGLETATEGENAYRVRNGRQKVSEAPAENGAVTARVKWTGISGIELGMSGQYQHDVTQGGVEDGVEAILLVGHADIRKGPFGFRALYAQWDLDGEAPEALGRDKQDGWYVEPAYYFETGIGDFGVFGRYNEYDNESGGGADSKFEQIDVGLNYWPHQNVVLKFDYAFLEAPEGGKDDDILNLGVGFNF